ncbi:hypothetical protein LU660_27940, partial [Pseudomonas sp. NMI4491_12]|nr:hypothetical protein [Pseudomonas sp. NMI4491_12]
VGRAEHRLITKAPPRSLWERAWPAKQATRCLAPALPVFAGTPAPTGMAVQQRLRQHASGKIGRMLCREFV